MEDKVLEKVNEKIEQVLKDDIGNNIDYLYKLSKIKHLTKEDRNMYNNYGNYGRYDGRYPGHGSYGDDYGRRGYDMKYRGHDSLDRMYNDYGRYMESRERYGANENTKTSLKYMLESMENFARMLKEDAQSQEEVQMIRETAQRIAQM